MSAFRLVYRLSRSSIYQFNNIGRLQQLLPPVHRHVQEPAICCTVTKFNHSFIEKARFQKFRFLSSAASQSTDKESTQASEELGALDGEKCPTSEDVLHDGRKVETNGGSDFSKASEKPEASGSESEHGHSKSHSVRKRRSSAKRTAFSDSDGEDDLSVEELVKLVAEKEELLKAKHKEVEKMQDKVLRSYAEMENVIDRTRREAESTKKYAVQNFAKSLLDVADNLARASSAGKSSLSKVNSSNSSETTFRLKELLAGVEMTEKQLAEVFRRFGVEKYDPVGEQFDPNRHDAVAQLSDPSKTPGTIASVLKTGYMLHERIIRHAEVIVVAHSEAVEGATQQSPTS